MEAKIYFIGHFIDSLFLNKIDISLAPLYPRACICVCVCVLMPANSIGVGFQTKLCKMLLITNVHSLKYDFFPKHLKSISS